MERSVYSGEYCTEIKTYRGSRHNESKNLESEDNPKQLLT
jgi:hypothetical protein